MLKPDFQKGTSILGKWNKRKYLIEGLLGEGSNGKVYLVKSGMSHYALKMGFSVVEHQSEVNVLKSITTTSKNIPYLVDVDDFHQLGQDFPFYVMKYVKGAQFREYLSIYGEDWFYIVGFNILQRLNHLHTQGWVFGDLKMDNIIVSGYGDVELIDYGGVTQKGRSVKQFTEIYDRGYWGAGTRTAEESYDLFSFAILCIQSADMDQKVTLQCLPQYRDIDYLKEMIHKIPLCEQVAPFLHKALQGKWKTSQEACEEWKQIMFRLKGKKSLQPIQASWLKGALVASVLAFVSALFLAFH